MDRITLKEACDLLGISRPTLNVYRKKYQLSEVMLGGLVRLSQSEIIEKVILRDGYDRPDLSLSIHSNSKIKDLQPLPGVYDLRKISSVDVHGVMALLCSIKSHLKISESNTVTLLVDGSPFCSYLESMGFFTEVERANAGRVLCNYDAIQKGQTRRSAIILPLHLIGYRGAEKKILDDLYDPLLKQGFSEDYCGHIGWIIGELCDNAHTHSEGPCYLMIEALESSSTAKRFLCISVGDIGVGIPESLKRNPKYSRLENRILLPMAFQSEVSRMEVEPKRGKGLNDVMSISKGNKSWLVVDTGGLGMRFDFRTSADKIEFCEPIVSVPGTRFTMVMIDSEFQKYSRPQINEIMQKFLESS
jgi:predicted DNA-binding transcriptional regulator AlpA